LGLFRIYNILKVKATGFARHVQKTLDVLCHNVHSRR